MPTNTKRLYSVKYDFSINSINEKLELWVPAPLESSYQRCGPPSYHGNFSQIESATEPIFKTNYLYTQWQPQLATELPLNFTKDSEHIRPHNKQQKHPLANSQTAHLQIEFQAELSPRQGGDHSTLSEQERRLFLQARPHVPIDGVVAELAQKLSVNTKDPMQIAKNIYRWVCDHSERDPDQIGCGLGHVKDSITSGHICGRCVDITSVFVALMRAAQIPTREVFGIRLKKNGDISESQHCRAEFYIDNVGWFPCDPADVSKACLQEKIQMGTTRYHELCDYHFGQWEPNCLAYNFARDFKLQPSTGSTENYLMYPIALLLDERLNPHSPQKFKYSITSVEVPQLEPSP